MNKDNLTNYFLNEALCYLMNSSIAPLSFGPLAGPAKQGPPIIVFFPDNWALYIPTNKYACPAILEFYLDSEELFNIGFITKVGFKDIDHPYIKQVIF